MLGVITKALPALVAAGGIYASMQESNPLIDYAKVALTQYEISTISRFVVYNAIGKNKVPTPQNFRQYLRETMQSSRDPSLDYWDQPYIMQRKGKTVIILSSGPDKKRGTADDIKQEFSLPF
jgi:hypothetical protein